jgi:hypothetical protein
MLYACFAPALLMVVSYACSYLPDQSSARARPFRYTCKTKSWLIVLVM